MSDKASKTEKPTPQRLKKARRDGQVPRTVELSAWTAVLLASILLPRLVHGLGELVADLLQGVREVVLDPRPERGITVMRQAGVDALWLLAPFFGVMVAAALVSNAAQGGLRVYPGKFKPRFSVLNPGKGLKQLVSAHSAWTFAKTMLKFVVFGWIGYTQLRDAAVLMTSSGSWSLGAAAAAAVGAATHVLRVVAGVGLVLAAADYAAERRRIGTSLKMSPDEVKREHKQTDGDPFLKGMIRGKQRAMSRNRMLADLSSADVVLVNPTHVAVALKYEPGLGAPRVVARGAGAAAARIREEAAELRLPMVEDVPLARTVFRLCDIGDEIPSELFDAVAGVFVFVLGLRRRGVVGGVHRNPAAGRERVGVAV
ncbi:EscU/YscU/HrcU family type III secretion system export apparatus switch protein [Phycicoccus sonneratiae]|uniref:EscU/YscU/HrcU family type III secretion system export apparatus switch protein n=1 Tax=Phycicoccus sonneratiae TaxID=2807628 RepID=A0ABS2CNJ1_9MICO|nr:EscU/YscU/HrcU family type III secretion system export apparatus switch protein [Phycicoccus sonneraticus]MBM6401446.1 EscU/YscU/HrcU family type III secretion system export apparatus switch protein [Phycicoccus sonneraticus]